MAEHTPMSQPEHHQSVSWFDCPSPDPKPRKPFDDVLAEFAERTGRPLWNVTRSTLSNDYRRCDRCGSRVAVRLDGSLGEHSVRLAGWMRQRCDASGQAVQS